AAGQREDEREYAALPGHARYGNAAMVPARDGLCGEEADPEATHVLPWLLRAGVAVTVERLEDAWQRGCGDAGPIVAHRQAGMLAAALDAHLDTPTSGAVLDRVAQQVDQDPLDALGIPRPDQLAGTCADQRHVVVFGE